MPRSQTIREDFIMGVTLGFLVTLEAEDGKGKELGEFLPGRPRVRGR